MTTNPGGPLYTVWSSCLDCGRPTAAVARIELLTLEDWEGDLPYQKFDVAGHDAKFYGPADDRPVSRLYVDVGADQPAMFVGWGL